MHRFTNETILFSLARNVSYLAFIQLSVANILDISFGYKSVGFSAAFITTDGLETRSWL